MLIAILLLVIPTGAPVLDGGPTTPGGAVGCGGDAPARSGGGRWECTWSDEFDGVALSDTWELIPYGLGSSCLFNDDPEFVYVSGGQLHLVARELPGSHWCTTEYGREYGGGGIQSLAGFSQRYGRFEVRALLPAGAGLWPAFWMLPADDSYDGEIDILEAYGGRGENVDATLHAPAAGPGPQRICDVDYSSRFHTYALEWEPGRMRIFYDDVLCADFTGMADDGTSPPALPATFDKPYHLLLDIAVQPFWPPDDSTVFPATMRVDYVRVWQ